MTGYSVAIRTLGSNPEVLHKELESIARQSVAPDKVVIYIARGYQRPSFNVMGEEYVETEKGMVSQRAVDYHEITTPLILLLDDDVELASDSAEILMSQLAMHNADCIAADTFANHKMTVKSKIKAALTSLVFPRFNQKWAFRLHSNGSFSYINNPRNDCYPSQSAAGPAALWRKESLLNLDFDAERWLDRLGFAYGDDDLEFFKLHVNGGRLMVSFNSKVRNMDAKTASADFQHLEKKFYVRAFSNHVRWHRMQFTTRTGLSRAAATLSYMLKQMWLIGVNSAFSIAVRRISPARLYIKGLYDGMLCTKSAYYRSLPSYKI